MTCRECDQPATIKYQCKYHYRKEGRRLKKLGLTREQPGRPDTTNYDDFWLWIRDELKLPEAQPR